MASDDWAEERAAELADLGERERHNLGFRARMADAAVAVLREAEERSRQSILARLNAPDEAMVEAFMEVLFGKYNDKTNYQAWVDSNWENAKIWATDSLRALASHLSTHGGNKDEDT